MWKILTVKFPRSRFLQSTWHSCVLFWFMALPEGKEDSDKSYFVLLCTLTFNSSQEIYSFAYTLVIQQQILVYIFFLCIALPLLPLPALPALEVQVRQLGVCITHCQQEAYASLVTGTQDDRSPKSSRYHASAPSIIPRGFRPHRERCFEASKAVPAQALPWWELPETRT